MANPGLSDEACLEAIKALKEANGVKADAARLLGIPRRTLGNRLTRAAERGLDGSTPRPLPPGQRVKGVSTLYNSDGEVTAQWVKTVAEQSAGDIVAEIREAFADLDRAPLIPAPSHSDDDLATVYPLADWHIGMLSWHEETGHNYDLKIADKTIREAMSRLIACAPASKQGVVLGLGDMLHADGYEPMTARSKNILDVDGRYPRVLKAAIQLITFTIEQALQKHESVLVRILPGNHDDQSAIFLSIALALRFEQEPRVTVDEHAGRFWWWRWGSVLLGATHGDKAKMADLPLLMASHNAEAWGQTKYRHIYTGHIHTQTGIEKAGVTVESFQTPAVPDAWHAAMGYGAGRSLTAITHHRAHGEIARQKVNIV
jgi:hypothetical protein